MPTKNARVNVVMEKPLYTAVSGLAKREGTSMSMVVRDLVKEAIELREDIELVKIAEQRERSLTRTKKLSHKDIWG
jgi:metal-responsive CopG/Arc/MetJ family transcriptional regulator